MAEHALFQYQELAQPLPESGVAVEELSKWQARYPDQIDRVRGGLLVEPFSAPDPSLFVPAVETWLAQYGLVPTSVIEILSSG